MGIDKSNIRFVVHMSMPKTIENYYQEIGRAGRDGLEAEVMLLYSAADMSQRKSLIDQLEESPYKQHAYEKLQSMVRFANAESCRHQMLAAYFDDRIERCDTACDNCINPEREKEEITTEGQKFLSALYRTGQRFGMHYVVDVLRGSSDQRILENGHDKLSVYGIGGERSKTQWLSIGERLLELEYAGQGDHKVLYLTEAGSQWLRSGTELTIAKERLNVKERMSKKKVVEQVDYDVELFEKLRGLRKEIADEQGIAPYMVFNDKTLKEFAAHQPLDKLSMLQISGVGEVKFERYGEEFLLLIRSLV
ncbi:MAG: RQC domain-containing protein, partial [Sulfurimonadaceae bacterium]|nr:RQC domain-containing protein [Sulfurimonadaceae bacterium]